MSKKVITIIIIVAVVIAFVGIMATLQENGVIDDVTTEAPKQEEPKQETKSEKKQAAKGETVYAVQIFAVGKKLDPKAREFMGYTPKGIQGEKL